jgi:16S rRNA (adenine1518-N6/adenine1519-N6)-dimethyltransferase
MGDEIQLDQHAPMNLREICRKHNIRFKKSLGQNLLLDDNINRIMVDAAALTKEDAVVEVGAGLGALTRRLIERAGQVLSVEIDATFIPVLEEQFGHVPNMHLFRGDILNHSLVKLAEEHIPGAANYKMVSNLPYYITTPVLFHFIESPLYFSRLVTMLQLEVGERLVSEVNSENYGILAIAGRLYGGVDFIHRVPASCFLPQPKVDSCIVRFNLRQRQPGEVDPQFVMKIVRAAFSQRRKTLRNSLTRGGSFGAPKEAVLEAMEAAGIDPGRRPQTLDVEEFKTLAREVKSRL